MKTLLSLLLTLTITLGAQHALAINSVYIQNPSFDIDTAGGWAGNNITGWVQVKPIDGFGGTDDDAAAGPSMNSGKRPDRACVAFLQSGFGHVTSLSQDLTGLDTSKEYVLQFYHAASAGTAMPTNIFDVALVYNSGASEMFLGNGFSGFTNTPVGAGNPYNFEALTFTPPAANVTLRFRSQSVSASAGSALLLDAVSMYEKTYANEITIQNPSFEASAPQPPGGGGFGFVNITPSWAPLNDTIAGWEYWDGGYNSATFGVGTNGNPYIAPAFVPEGNCAFIDNKSERWYAASGNSTQLKQTINGLSNGQGYYLSFKYNARPAVGNAFSPSNFVVRVGGIEVLRDDFLEWTAPYYSTTVVVTANASSMELIFETSGSPDGVTMVIDDVGMRPVPEPFFALFAALGVCALLARRK